MSSIWKTRAPRWKVAGALIALVVAAGCVHQAPPTEATPIAKPAAKAPAAQPPIDAEIAKQERIYGSRGADVPAGYVTYRTLSAYAELLPSGFSAALRRLGSGDRWLDIGAGGGHAILDYYAPDYVVTSRGKALAVAISIEDRRTDQWREHAMSIGGDRIRYLHGKRLREYSREELGTFQIITDVYGGFSYTENLSQFLERVLGLLETNGSFYTLAASVRLEDGKDNPAKTWYLTELLAEKCHLRGGRLRIEKRLGDTHRADSRPQGLQRRLGSAHEAAALRGGESSWAPVPARALATVEMRTTGRKGRQGR
jgi:SAM-dependent methyltransferase